MLKNSFLVNVSMKYGIGIVNSNKLDPKLVIEYAITADESGWDGVFLSDCFSEGPYTDPWILLAGIATRTKTIKLGTWVTPLARRQPWQIALDLATLDHLSNGRVIFGAGLGVPEDFTWFGLPSNGKERAEKLDEALDIVQGLWDGGVFSYNGKHFTITEAKLPITPIQKPRIPIWLGGWWPNKKPFDRGAKWDGMMPYWNSYPELLPENSLREMTNYYHGKANSFRDILLPISGNMMEIPAEYTNLCEEVGISWLMSYGDLRKKDKVTYDFDKIRAGPPR